MFAREVDKHQARAALPPSTASRMKYQIGSNAPNSSLPDAFKSSSQPPFRQNTFQDKSTPSSSVNALRPSSSTVLNGSMSVTGFSKREDHKRPVAHGQGLAATLGGGNSFQENNPVAISNAGLPASSGNGSIHEAVYFDENDFEDDLDLDLDVENPDSKGTTFEPLSSTFAMGASVDASDRKSSGLASSSSNGIPLPWSSSPAHHQNSKTNLNTEGLRARPSATELSKSTEDLNPRPKKRRTLPWLDQQPGPPAPTSRFPNFQRVGGKEMNTQSTASGLNRKEFAVENTTPLRGDAPKSTYPWDKTASAIKAEQKIFRQERKRLAESKTEDLEDSETPPRTIDANLPLDVQPIFLSDEQKKVMNLVVRQGTSVFFTGSAGTGKSVLLREIIKEARNKFKREPDRVAITASTGLAACNVGGVTLHSFSGIGLGKEPATELVKKIKRNPKAKNRWMRTKMLIIDEISMVDGELFDKLETVARLIRRSGKAFGGIQLVVTGDFFQLPPVPDSGKISRFAFEAGTWSTSISHTIGLTQIFRQSDPVFAGMLNEMRVGKMTPRSINTFQTLSRPIRYGDGLEATELFPTRAEVENANNARMRNLPGNSMIFEAVDGGRVEDKAQRAKLLSNCMAPVSIELKKDAQVMLIKNTDGTLVNGSLGKVIGFMNEKQFDTYNKDEEDLRPGEDLEWEGPDTRRFSHKKEMGKELMGDTGKKWPMIRFALPDGTSRSILVQPETWKIELPNGEVQASRVQIPVILAWALSIHKAQGQTLARVKVDLGKVFEKGQAYVALSRATCQEGLQVLRFDPKKVLAHDKVGGFYNSLYSAARAIDSSREPAAKGTASRNILDVDGESDEDYEWSIRQGV